MEHQQWTDIWCLRHSIELLWWCVVQKETDVENGQQPEVAGVFVWSMIMFVQCFNCWIWCSQGFRCQWCSLLIREHEIADITKKTRIYTILSEIFTLCLCFWKEYCFPVFSIICRVKIAVFNNKTGFFNDFDTISRFFSDFVAKNFRNCTVTCFWTIFCCF
jgi:hypothetical protein